MTEVSFCNVFSRVGLGRSNVHASVLLKIGVCLRHAQTTACITTIRFCSSGFSYVLNQVKQSLLLRDDLFIISRVIPSQFPRAEARRNSGPITR